MSQTDDYLESLYKSLHDFELERSDKLDAQISLPTAVVTGLLAVSAFYMEHFPELEWRPGVVLFTLVLGVYGCFLVLAIYCLIRSYFSHKYDWLPPPEVVQENADGLNAHYEALEDGLDVDERVKADLQREILSVYKTSASFNRHTNIARVGWLHWTTRWIIASIITLVISRPIYYFGVVESKPQEVRITGIAGIPVVQKVEVVGPDTQKVQITSAPAVQKVEVVNPPSKVEVSGLPEVQKVEVVTPAKKEGQ
jgi:hypothetical protein